MNRVKTAMLLATLTALLLWAGQALAGQTGFMMALLFAGVMNIGAYWFSDKIVLRMYGAQQVTDREAPELVAMVRTLAGRADLPMPKVYVIPEEAPNAFATGRSPHHGAVAVTEGIVRLLTRDELAGVIAHELGHIKNRDTLIMAVAATIAGAVSMLASLAHWGAIFGGGRSSDSDDRGSSHPLAAIAGILIAPLAAMLIQMAISRSREYLADEGAARLTRKPWALAGALEKLELAAQQIPLASASQASAHMYIVNPLAGVSFASLFSTHPPTEERIARLRAMRMV